jgi:hypothetical protein
MLQPARQIDRVAFQADSLAWPAEQPVQNRAYRHGANSGVVSEVDEPLSGVTSLIVEVQPSLDVNHGILKRAAKPMDWPGAVMRLEKDIRVIEVARDIEQLAGDCVCARELASGDMKEP